MKKKNILIAAVFLVSLLLGKQADAFFLEELLQEPRQFWIGNTLVGLIYKDGYPELIIPSSVNYSSHTLYGDDRGEPVSAQAQQIDRLAKLLRSLNATTFSIRLVQDAVRSHNISYINEEFSLRHELWPHIGNSASGYEVHPSLVRDRYENNTSVSNNLHMELRFILNGVYVTIPLQFQFNRQPGEVFWLWSEDYFCEVYRQYHCASQRIRRFMDPLGTDVLSHIYSILMQLLEWPELLQQIAGSNRRSSNLSGLLNQDSISAYQYPLVTLPRSLNPPNTDQMAFSFQSGVLDYTLNLPVMGRLSDSSMSIITAVRRTRFQPIIDNPGITTGIGLAAAVIIVSIFWYVLTNRPFAF